MKFTAFLFLLVVIAAGAAGFFVLVPYGPSTETFIDIPTGTSSISMARQLQREGIIRNQYAFLLLRKLRGGRLKAGEYRFDHPATATEVYARIARGDVYTKAVTVPEGYNIFDIAAAVEHAGLASRGDFLRAAHDNVQLIADIDPTAISLEGYLFPDTYRFSHHTTPQLMMDAMVKRFRSAMAALGNPPDVKRTVLMASLVEREVRVDSERPMVAGVFENRLKINMPLATDPTVIYAALLEGRWRGTIYQSDLQSQSPYNTYRHAGLPPGPICSPGMAALRAALHPAETENLYFVADAAGHTNFSASLKEHDQQVQEYREATLPAAPPPPPAKAEPTPRKTTHAASHKPVTRKHRAR